jgi:hypothetical protein
MDQHDFKIGQRFCVLHTATALLPATTAAQLSDAPGRDKSAGISRWDTYPIRVRPDGGLARGKEAF